MPSRPTYRLSSAPPQPTGAADSSNARSRGPQPPTPNLYRLARRANALLAAAVARTCEHLAGRHILDPYSWSILQELPPAAVAPAGLLAWTKCRYAELNSIDMRALLAGETLVIPSSKNGPTRLVSGWPELLWPYWKPVPPDVKITVISYDSLCQRIRRAARRVHVRLPKDAHDKTHIFRHLHASWRAANGAPIADISAELGHTSELSTRQYIHPLSLITSNH